ncbi:hypothetical protein PR048_030652 [Dryococelus australis]|uniref:Uncharacterized protein n=1 Tax=Dryococelus australis TaxID=614101 RepID=A0ABQ9G9J4_9NEOP|nr:hypothetical protein PR048_030652 [Dryococelus australis]
MEQRRKTVNQFPLPECKGGEKREIPRKPAYQRKSRRDPAGNRARFAEQGPRWLSDYHRVQSPAEPSDFRKRESCRTMPLVGGFSRGSPVSPAILHSGAATYSHFNHPINLIGSQDLAVESRPNLFTHSLTIVTFHRYRQGWISCDVFVGATVAKRLACSPSTRVIRLQSPAVSLRIFACGNRAGRCRWSAGFLGDLPFPSPFHSGDVPCSPRFILIGSQYLDVKSRRNLFTILQVVTSLCRHSESSPARELRRGEPGRQPVSPEHSCVVAKRIGNSSSREEVCDASKFRRCRYSWDSQKGINRLRAHRSRKREGVRQRNQRQLQHLTILLQDARGARAHTPVEKARVDPSGPPPGKIVSSCDMLSTGVVARHPGTCHGSWGYACIYNYLIQAAGTVIMASLTPVYQYYLSFTEHVGTFAGNG